jgi:hypothetical protein
MPFFIDGDPTPSEISDAVNYLLANSQQTTSTNIVNGQVTDAVGSVVSYLYKYLYVKYADSFDGTVNFSNTPTGRSYYGLRNNDSATESTNPADYIWYQVTGGFGTTKFVFYSVTGGRRINIVVGLSAPSILYQADSGAAINLDQISGSDGASSRICYAKSTSTSLASTPTTYQTSGPSSFPPTNTWGGAETWQATPPTLAVNEALFQSDGIYNPVTDLTTWNVPYLSNLKVGALSAISANLGTVTAGELIVTSPSSSTPTISGTTMTGSGSHLYNDGRFALGNSSGNIVFDGTFVYLNGFVTSLSTYNSGVNLLGALVPTTVFSFSIAKAGKVMVNFTSYLYAFTSTSATGVRCLVSIQVKNSSGTLVNNAPTTGFACAPIFDNTSPTVKLASGNMAYSEVLNLAAGTYTLYVVRSTQTDAFDAAGNSVGISSIAMNINASAYQVIA